MRHSYRVLWVVVAFGAAAATAAVWPSRYFWRMASCPSGSGPNCVAAVTCTGDGGAAGAGTCTGSAPTTSPTQGLAMAGLSAFQLSGRINPVTLADGGTSACTFTGTGTLVQYSYRYSTAIWSPVGSGTLTIPAECVGASSCTWPDYATGVQSDRTDFIPSAVATSCGTALDVMLDGQQTVAR